MNENIVEWTLVLNKEYLEEVVDRKLAKKLARQLPLESGKLDLLYEDEKGTVLVIEIKIGLRTTNDWRSVEEQILAYVEEVRERMFPTKTVAGIILSAHEDTKNPDAGDIHRLKSYGISAMAYSINQVQELYALTLEHLVKNSGVNLNLAMRPSTIGVCFLRYLNRIIGAFEDSNTLVREEIRSWMKDKGFGCSNSRIDHLCLVANYFGLMDKNRQAFSLTQRGRRFRDVVNRPIGFRDLSIEQKRILLESILEGIDTRIKASIFWFLRFASLTGGRWVPRSSTQLSEEKLGVVNTLMDTEFNATSARDMLYWACNYCEELELVKRVKRDHEYDWIVLTSLGSRVHSFLETLLIARREMIQIPLEAY